MRVVLQTVSESGTGRKALIAVGQVYQIGRSELADLPVPHDQLLSSLHFEVHADGRACYIQDLQSRNKTFVNGQPVTRELLRNGDRITAGGTQFVVHIEGDRPDEAIGHTPETTAVATAIGHRGGSPQAMHSEGCTVRCKLRHCRSGLAVLSASGPTSAETVVLRLQKAFALYLVLDLNKLKEPLPESSEDPVWLLAAIPEQMRAKHSPVIIAANAETDIAGLVQQCWGCDGLTAVYSAEEPELVQEQLQRFAGGFIRPSILKPQLTETVAETAEALLSGIEAAIVEDESPGGWMLLVRDELIDKLAKLGFSFEESPAAEMEPTGPV